MTIRIDKESFRVEETNHEKVLRITAKVTKDDVSVQNPKIHQVSVLYNRGAPADQLVSDLEAAIPVEDTELVNQIEWFKTNYTSEVIPAPVAEEPVAEEPVNEDFNVKGNLNISGQLIVNGTVIQ